MQVGKPLKALFSVGIAVATFAFGLSYSNMSNASAVPAKNGFAQLRKASLILYSQGTDGSMQMHCTVTVFAQHDNTYLGLTAAHCLVNEDHSAVEAAPLFVSTDADDSKTFMAAEITTVGDLRLGDDFAVLSFQSPTQLGVMPLGSEKGLQDGDTIRSVGSPLGLGLVAVQGQVASLKIRRHFEHYHWDGFMMLQFPVLPGQSGSAVIDANGKIIGIVVGKYDVYTIVMPISRFLHLDPDRCLLAP